MEKQMKLLGDHEYTVVANEWKKHGKHRIYFDFYYAPGGRKASARACWDVIAQEWVKVKGNIGHVQKQILAKKFAEILSVEEL